MTERQYKATWFDLGCPTEPGTYSWDGKPIEITAFHIAAAEDNPEAICTVIRYTPLSGPETYALGAIEQPGG
jgi:hypothetical protein